VQNIPSFAVHLRSILTLVGDGERIYGSFRAPVRRSECSPAPASKFPHVCKVKSIIMFYTVNTKVVYV